MTIDLDTRLRAASDSLLQASEGLSGAGAGRPPRSLRPLAVAAAAVVAVVAMVTGATVLGAGDDGDPDSDVSTDSSGVPRLIADPVPEGMSATGAADLPVTDTDSATTMAVTVFGEPTADDPFATTDLAIAVVEGEQSSSDEVPSERTVIVRGREGRAYDGSPLGNSVAWEEEPGLRISLYSHALTRDQLLAIAEGLVVDSSTVSPGDLPPELPGSLEPVGSASGLGFGLLPVPMSASSPGHIVGYQDESGERSVSVGLVRSDQSAMAVIRWMTRASARTEVRGHPGWAGSYEHQSGSEATSDGSSTAVTTRISTVVWVESPGVVGLVQGSDLDEDEVRAIAESLRPATDEEWDALRRMSASDGDSSSSDRGGSASDSGSVAPESDSGSSASESDSGIEAP